VLIVLVAGCVARQLALAQTALTSGHRTSERQGGRPPVRDLKFARLTTNDGLSQDRVVAIMQDRLGFMWLSTGEGLNRYDGHSFVVYKNDPRDSGSLSDNGTGDVFIRDLVNRVTRKLSVAGNGQQTESPSFGASVSADGRSVAFESFSSRLVPDDTNGALDVFVADLPSGSISRISLATDGGQADERSYSPSISADGRIVAFASFATNLVLGDTNGLLDVFLRRRDQQTTTRLSVGPDGAGGDGLSFAPVVSADGERVVFSSEAGNLVPHDSNGIRDVFVASTESGALTRLSRPGQSKAQGDGPSLGPVVDASGVMVAFASFATNLVEGDTNGQSDVFVTESPSLKSARGRRHTGRQ